MCYLRTHDAADVSYRTSSGAASGVGLVILLYEQLVRDLRRATTAMDAGDIQTRTSELDHALQVVCQLQGRLDMETGGEVARNLDRFYANIQATILQAQCKASKPGLLRLIDDVLSVREAWLEIDRTSTVAETHAPQGEVQNPPNSGGRNWKA